MHFTEDEIREIRNRLPLEVPTVTDSLQSSDGSSALSAKQGNLLGGRLSLVESTEAAMRNIQTIYPWNGSSGVYSMVSVPDDTVNNATNVRVAYELKKRTDDLSTQVNYIQQIIDQLTSGGGGGGGGGSTVSWGVELSNHTVPLIVNGVSKTICLDGYSSGGGGGTGGGYIGSTQVQTNSTPGQNLEGIGNATLSGNLILASSSKIYFGDPAGTGTPYIEYDTVDGRNQFHFNKGLYSTANVTAGGPGTGGGGGGTGTDENAVHYTSDSPSASQQAQARGNIGLPSQLSTGYLKYTGSGWTFDNGSSPSGTLYLGSSGHPQSSLSGDVSMSSFSNGQVLYYYNGSWTNASLDISDIGLAYGMSGSGYLYYTSGSGWSLESGSGGGSDTWRPISVNGVQKLGSSTSSGSLNFEGQGNTSVSYSNGSIVISSSGGTPASVGSLSISSSAQTVPSSSESFSNNITLHKVSKTGSYSDLSGTPNLSNYVTSTELGTTLQGYMDLTTNQTVSTGLKTFVEGVGIGSSNKTLTYDSVNNRFVLNGSLYVSGSIVAVGAVTAGNSQS